eukprot:CAMPEP_0116557432 /NCGR_PEP_ID=MMETSP0397-20121206/9238_1 /TAXON_ID=216820 /ORGANISM="Cyclophora tenuis, Strain ECT3854" /LENGTH=197 /DNA_ID=CAMNT_0004082891 /DNA_START=60 /DNA_END=653 /DNA_ORIENTATION=+
MTPPPLLISVLLLLLLAWTKVSWAKSVRGSGGVVVVGGGGSSGGLVGGDGNRVVHRSLQYGDDEEEEEGDNDEEEEEDGKSKAKGRKGTKKMKRKKSKSKSKSKSKNGDGGDDDDDDDGAEGTGQDGGGDVGPFPEGSEDDACPEEAPNPRDPCTGIVSCEYGEESCCGQTFTSYICDCFFGEFACLFTDACFSPDC